jgi:CrcB protein
MPWGTAAVNGTGTLFLGMVVGLGVSGAALAMAAGVASGFTTYSTWMVESVALWDEGRGAHMPALVNWIGAFAVGLGLAWVGWLIGSAVG